MTPNSTPPRRLSDVGDRGRELSGETCSDVVCNMRCLWSVVFIALASLLTYGAARLSTPIINNCQLFQEEDSESLIIIDTDGDWDDAVAVMLLLEVDKRYFDSKKKKGLKILGITTVRGSNEAAVAAKNVHRILIELNRTHVPVYQGATRNLKTSPPLRGFYGSKASFTVDEKNSRQEFNEKKHGVNAMIDFVNQYPGQVTILALGPLTNIALAIRLDQDFMLKIKSLIISGGNSIGSDHFLPRMERNLWMDPEANYVVMKDSLIGNGTVTVAPLQTEICKQFNKKWRKVELKKLNSSKLRWLNRYDVATDEIEEKLLGWECGDPITASLVIYPKIVKQNEERVIVPVTEGEFRGGLIEDYNIDREVNTIRIIKEINVDYYKKLLLCYLGNP